MTDASSLLDFTLTIARAFVRITNIYLIREQTDLLLKASQGHPRMQQTTDDGEPRRRTNAEPATEGRHEGMGGLAKGLAIIEAFGIHDVMSVADAARASSATRAAARRCLLTLSELGYVERSGREFRPLERLRRGGTLVYGGKI